MAADDTPPPAVVAALSDDLNTPKAIAALEALAAPETAGALKAGAQFMGLLGHAADAWLKGGGEAGPDAAEIDRLIDERKAARETKDFARADQIRDDLAAQGIRLLDRPDGTTDWERSA